MNYIGSKNKLSPWINDVIREHVDTIDLSDMTFCDMFAGTGIIGRLFKPHVNHVVANDLE